MNASQCPVVVALFLVATLAAAAEDPPPHSQNGVLTPDAMSIIEKSIAVGWTEEQVRFLAGVPELKQPFVGGVEVWRYRTDFELLLVAFRAGKVEQVSRRPIPPAVSSRAVTDAIEQTTKAPSPSAESPQVQSSYYPEVGKVLMLNLGSHLPEVREAFRHLGFQVTDVVSDSAVKAGAVSCFRQRGGTRACILRPDSKSPWGWDVTNATRQLLYLSFDPNGKLVAVVHLVSSDDNDAIQRSYSDYAATFKRAFNAPSSRQQKEVGDLNAWFARMFISNWTHSALVSGEGWSSKGVSADMLLYESTDSPRHLLFLIHYI